MTSAVHNIQKKFKGLAKKKSVNSQKSSITWQEPDLSNDILERTKKLSIKTIKHLLRTTTGFTEIL